MTLRQGQELTYPCYNLAHHSSLIDMAKGNNAQKKNVKKPKKDKQK